jgi:type III secretion protein T
MDPKLPWSLFAPVLMGLPRVGAAIIVAPLFPTTLFPTLLRGAVVVSLSLYLYPHLAAHMPPMMSWVEWVGLIGKEACIGALLGFAAGTLIWAFETAGSLLDFQVGFSNSQYFDPFGGHEAGPLSQLWLRLGTVLFVAAGGLQVLAALLFESFHLWPVTSFYPSLAHLEDFAAGSIRSFMDLVVRLAAPAVLLLALIDFGFGLVSRVVPQLNVFFFTMPIKGALTAVMLALYLSFVSDIVAGWLSDLGTGLEHLGPLLSGH